jgi:hypothetical protein
MDAQQAPHLQLGQSGDQTMFATMRRHHHPPDAWEPDDLDEIAEEETLEEIRHFFETAPWTDMAEEWPGRGSARPPFIVPGAR